MTESLFSCRRRKYGRSWQVATSPQRGPSPNVGLDRFCGPGFLAAQYRSDLAAHQASIAARSQAAKVVFDQIGGRLQLVALIARSEALGLPASEVIQSLEQTGWTIDESLKTISKGPAYEETRSLWPKANNSMVNYPALGPTTAWM